MENELLLHFCTAKQRLIFPTVRPGAKFHHRATPDETFTRPRAVRAFKLRRLLHNHQIPAAPTS